MAHAVTRHTLPEALADLEAALPDAAFVAIDFEMSGIGPWRQDQADTAQERYTKMAAVASKYTVVQFGVCVYTETSPGQFDSRPYNFFTFPGKDPDRDITLSSSAIKFLAENKMDFQTWLSDGIPYVTASQAEELRSKILTPAPPRKGQRVEVTWDADKEYIANAFRDFDAWLAEQSGKGEKPPPPLPAEYIFPPCNSWLRRVVYQEIEDRVVAAEREDIETESRSVDGKQTVVALLLDDEAKAARAARQLEERQAKLDKALGVTRVFDAVVAAKKPLIGHNLLYDLMFMLKSFDEDLPTTYNAFAARVEELFPVVFDTKFLASTGSVFPSQAPGAKLDDTTLGTLYQKLASDGELNGVSIAAPEFFSRYREEGTFHEAGWDAHCTGAVFAALSPAYVIDTDGSPAGEGPEGIRRLAAVAANRLHGTGTIMRWCLRGDPLTQAIAEEGATIYLTGLTKDDKTNHISAIFAEKLVGEARHEVKWGSETSAFISVYPQPGAVIDEDHLIREVHAKLISGRMVSSSVQVHPWEHFCAGVAQPLAPIDEAEAPEPHGTWGKVNAAWKKISWVFGSSEAGPAGDGDVGAESGSKRPATTAAGDNRSKRARW